MVTAPLPSVQSVTKISLFLRVSALPLVNRYVLVILSSTAPILIVRPAQQNSPGHSHRHVSIGCVFRLVAGHGLPRPLQ